MKIRTRQSQNVNKTSENKLKKMNACTKNQGFMRAFGLGKNV